MVAHRYEFVALLHEPFALLLQSEKSLDAQLGLGGMHRDRLVICVFSVYVKLCYIGSGVSGQVEPGWCASHAVP